MPIYLSFIFDEELMQAAIGYDILTDSNYIYHIQYDHRNYNYYNCYNY